MTSFDKTNVIVSGSRSAMGEYANYTTVFVKPTMVGGKLVLTQAMINKPNTKYVIKWNFELTEDISLPTNCLLEFDGGSISATDNNITLTGNNTEIIADIENIIDKKIIPSGTWKARAFYPEWFGATGDNSVDEFVCIQRAIDFAKDNSFVNTVEFNHSYRADCAVFVKGKNVIVDGKNNQITFHYRWLGGRVGFVVGQSHETNYDICISRVNNGETPWLGNDNFVNPPVARENIDQYIYSGSSYTQAENVFVKNLKIVFDYSTYPDNWGGYGINFANSLNCGATNIIVYHGHEAFNAGSDISPETPGNVGLSLSNIIAKEPDDNCFYSLGFICNCKNVSLTNAYTLDAVGGTQDTDHNSFAIAYSDNVYCNNIHLRLGEGSTLYGQRNGLEVNSCSNSVFSDITVENYISGIAYYFLYNIQSANNKFKNITIKNTHWGIKSSSKYAIFDGIVLNGCTYDLCFDNADCSDNKFFNHNIKTIYGHNGADSAYNSFFTLRNEVFPTKEVVIPVSAYANSVPGQTMDIITLGYSWIFLGVNDSLEMRIPYHGGRIYAISASMLIMSSMAAADGSFEITIKKLAYFNYGREEISNVYTHTFSGESGHDRDVNVDAPITDLSPDKGYIIVVKGTNVKEYSTIRDFKLYVLDGEFTFTQG